MLKKETNLNVNASKENKENSIINESKEIPDLNSSQTKEKIQSEIINQNIVIYKYKKWKIKLDFVKIYGKFSINIDTVYPIMIKIIGHYIDSVIV